MSRKPDESVRSCAERARLAMWSLAVGESSLPARLEDAAIAIGILEPRDFPSDLRVSFAKIHEAITAEVSFEASIRAMTPERAVDVAKDIYELAAEVARREVLEDDADV